LLVLLPMLGDRSNANVCSLPLLELELGDADI
jgi:hypothetical protein